MIDAHSKWMEVFSTKTTTTTKTISFLRSCFARFGLPVTVVSDNGPQFVSQEFKNYLSSMNIRGINTSFYKPSTNGLAENAVGIFKSAMSKFVGEDMQKKLDQFLLKNRITPHTTTGVSPSELMFGRKIRTVFDLVRPGELPPIEPKGFETIKSRVKQKQESQKKYSKGNRKLDLLPNDKVMARNFAKGPKWVPAKVHTKTGPLSYKCEFDDGSLIRRHQDQLWKVNPSLVKVPLGNSSPVATTTPKVATSPTPTTVSPTLAQRRERRTIHPPERLNL